MNPYDVEIERLKVSREITNPVDLIKLRLVVDFLKVTKNIKDEEILKLTNIKKSVLSRLKVMDTSVVSIDDMVLTFTKLNFTVNITIEKFSSWRTR